MTTLAIDDMLATYPADLGRVDRERLARCIEECAACAQACTACADACLSEPSVAELTTCIRTDLDCADICEATGRVLSRHTGYDANVTRAQLRACATVCGACADECARHADSHEHCRVCAEACRRCERACDELLASLG
ncbi:four-helix bundle copper-binding protein [Streptomyces marincola]|uniref:four-helix bundle copper-binding protein n=1 Tax=Streptomyces marincola TaxID=2878388 RepID=UPI001CF43FB8|nr:four-helix bundle copper-binding protein [Streptomyces marincola]UCM89679.1 four-helix bundle copper-binding protein [Streptomyces marincola]